MSLLFCRLLNHKKKIIFKEVVRMTTQTMNNFETLDLEALANIEGGGWVKCYAGTIGSALVGSAGGPVGYWGGALVGYATFC